MSAVLAPPASPPWLRHAISGSVGSVVMLALVVSLGVLAFAPLGADAARLGIAAAFACAAVSAVVYALTAGSAVPSGGPSSATSAILVGLVLQVLQSMPDGLAREAQLLHVVAAGSAAVALMGLLQVLMAALRVGRLVAFVPQTAMSGFMNGIAILVLLAQLPALLGVEVALWRQHPVQALAVAHPAALLLGLGTAGVIWFIAHLAPRLPGHVLGALAGTAAYLALRTLWPDPAFGPTLGAVVAELPALRLLSIEPTVLTDGLLHNARAIVVCGTTLALMGALETMLALRLIDQQTGSTSSENRALCAAGLANLLGGLAGAVPLSGLRAAGTAIANHGGRGRGPVLLALAATVLLLMALDTWIARLPRAVVAGVMVTIAVALADHWSRDMLRRWAREHRPREIREMRQSLLLVLVVAAITVVWGTAAGVGAGVALSGAALVRGLHGSVVRGRQTAECSTSRRVWPLAQERALAGLRQRILVLELEGAIFFGTAPRVASEAQNLPPDCRFVILDMRRVSTIDESGATMLRQLSGHLRSRGTTLLLAAVTAERPHGQRLLAFGTYDEGGQWHPDADRAIEAAESRLLAETGVGADTSASPLAASVLLRGLDADEIADVRARMTPLTLQTGERLFREGEPADGLYLVTRGTISVVSADGEQRFASFPPGLIFGETALLDGGGRTASAIADEVAEVLRLTLESLDTIAQVRPALAAKLYRNIARHGSERLRRASRSWRQAAG